jgi:hypothetical protein
MNREAESPGAGGADGFFYLDSDHSLICWSAPLDCFVALTANFLRFRRPQSYHRHVIRTVSKSGRKNIFHLRFEI